ncbi:MAG: Gfo/Idh/MocA family oxidoreductase [Hamadaea sp.]|nr:Gfo/Idh/MocA family oxidoreductase [Hamadaea sp.]
MTRAQAPTHEAPAPAKSAKAKPKRVALIGANGHGRSHRRKLQELSEANRLEVAAYCDVAEVDEPGEVPVYRDHQAMLAETRPDVVIICTPPHTHLPIALDCVRAGADLLLEKPPMLALADHETLQAALDETGQVCQVGFQALGSAGLTRVREAIASGALGEIIGISAFGAWQRDDAYWSRSPWAGKRTIDGALANPFAHATMQCLALLPQPIRIASIEVERYRARPIEVDDTATLRVRPVDGPPVVVAVTLCAEGFLPGSVLVQGTAGEAELEYPTDRLRLSTPDWETTGRADLLLNLLDDRDSLIAPLAVTAAFTAVLEHIHAAPTPIALDPARLVERHAGPARQVVIPGIDQLVRTAARRLALFSEISDLPTERP